MRTIEQTVKEIVAAQAGCEPNEIALEQKFIDDHYFDSLDHVEMVMALEDEFKLVVTDEEEATFKTVKDVIDFITAKTRRA